MDVLACGGIIDDAARAFRSRAGSYVLITDRYHWEQVDKACDAIVRHLPAVSALGGDEVRSAATRTTRADPAGDFTERAEAVPTAYRELRDAEKQQED